MSEASWWRQFRVLLWKDYLIRKRKLITVGGVVWTTLVLLSLYIVRVNINNEDYPTCSFPARALPSAGMLNFLQSFICSVNNECSPMDQYQEIPTYENSRLTQLQRQFAPLLYNESVLETAAVVPDALKMLGTISVAADEPTFLEIVKNGLRVQELFKNPSRVKNNILISKLHVTNGDAEAIMRAEISFRNILKGSMDICDPDSLSESLLVGPQVATNLTAAVCQLPSNERQELIYLMITELDISKYVNMVGNMFSKLNGDRRIIELSGTLRAVLSITRLDSFVPEELITLFVGAGEDEHFRYFNLTIITKLVDLFEPTFGNTEGFKSVRGIADAAITGIQWLHRVYSRHKNVNPVSEVTGLVLQRVDENLRLPGMEKVSSQLQKTMDNLGQSVDGIFSMDEMFDILPRIMTFFLRWTTKDIKHQIFFYSTLLTKLLEGAHRVIIDNMNIEQIVYNVSLRNPEAIQILTKLPIRIVSNAFDALSDADRTQILTAKLDSPDQTFCDEIKIENFFQISKTEVAVVKKLLCTEQWNKYFSDLITSFGIYEVKYNINTMASLLIQETLGKETDDQLYPLEKGFQVVKDLTRDLLQMGHKSKVPVDWSKLLGVSNHSDFMSVMREKQHLGIQVLITVHGALAKEIVKQNTILDLKITPLLIDVTTLVTAINSQLAVANKTTVANFKKEYPQILASMLTTLMDEDKTYALLSTDSIDVFCNGLETASNYMKFPFDVGSGNIITTLCYMTKDIDKGLQPHSFLGKAFKKIESSSSRSYSSVEWSKLISGLKEVYIRIKKEYPYVLESSTYGMDKDMKMTIDQLMMQTKMFWFSKENVSRSLQLSVNIIFRLLDVLNKWNVFSSEVWLKMKYSLNSANSLLIIGDEMLKLITAATTNTAFQSDLPQSTVVALNKILPNTPQLVLDISDMIANDSANAQNIIDVINEQDGWPCKGRSLSDALNLSLRSVTAVNGLETILCMNLTFQQEWLEYEHAQRVRTIMSLDQFNKTHYDPQIFLKFSKNFNSVIKDANKLKKVLDDVYEVNSSDVENPTFLYAWRHAVQVLNSTHKEDIFRKFFSKVDKVLNAINTSSERDSTSLSSVWDDYIQCINKTVLHCSSISKITWKNTLMFFSNAVKSIAEDLLTYFTEVNEPNANMFQTIGFTKKTGLYILYEKLADFVGVLLNSYWDYGFMNQIRRASKSEFWDCEAVVDSLVILPGSLITAEDLRKVRSYICPSLLYWVSLPRGENSLLDVISKPQYYFYTLAVQNLTSDYLSSYNLYIKLTNLLTSISIKNESATLNAKDLEIETLQNKISNLVDYVVTWKLNATDPSYRLFYQINKNLFLSSLYLTRIVTIVSKIEMSLNYMPQKLEASVKPDEMRQFVADLQVIQKKFKRRPSEVIALHFDLITDVLWSNQGHYLLSEAIQSRCEKLDNHIILADDNRFLSQVCSKKYDLIYGSLEQDLVSDFINTKQTLDDFIDDSDDGDIDVYEFFKGRKDLTNNLKLSIKYADDLGLPVYLKYMQNNLRQYNVILSFLSGGDWWTVLRDTYNGTIISAFFDTVEDVVDTFENIMTHPDQIHLVRLLRDVNLNDTSSFCQPNVSISDYIPDSEGRLNKLKQLVCGVEDAILYQQLPILLIVAQGFDNKLTISKKIDYESLYNDMNTTEERIIAIKSGPKNPKPPKWVTEENLQSVRRAANSLLSKESLIKISFGVLSNIVDASTLFWNNSQCSVCSKFTSWFKQLNLQLFKKQDYDNLLCHIGDMPLQNIYHTLKNDFHWDMALKELISTRNYTILELNKALNEFLEQIKLLVLDDVMSTQTKLSDCLVRNVSGNAFGNATLFVSVLSHTLKLLRAQLPHVQEVSGMRRVEFFKQIVKDISPNIPIEQPFKTISSKRLVYENFNQNDDHKKLLREIENSTVDLLALKTHPYNIKSWMKLQSSDWGDICQTINCTDLAFVINNNLNKNWSDTELSTLQTEEFWRFNFVSNVVHHLEDMLNNVAKLLGVASKVDLIGVFSGNLAAILDFVLHIMQESTAMVVMNSLKGFAEGLHPLIKDTPLDLDMGALVTGLQIMQQFRDYVILHVNLRLKVSEVFTNQDHIESELSRHGINNTNFWSLAAPRILTGSIDLKPLLTTQMESYKISSFVCGSEEMSQVVHPGDLDSVVGAEDVYGAVSEQLCTLGDQQTKLLLQVLLGNLNFGYVMEKIFKLILIEVNAASNLTEREGDAVLSKYKDMMQLLPLVQKNVAGLSESLSNEPVFEALKNFDSVGNLLSSSSFLTSAGNMLCGKPFVGNGNRFYKAIAETKDFSNEPDPAQLEVLPSDFCRSLYKDVLSMAGGKIVWSFVKPLIMGRILYTPDTPAVRRIIEKANSSFASAARLTGMVHRLAGSFPALQQLAEHRGALDALQTLASSPLLGDLAAGTAGDVPVASLLYDIGDLKGIGNLLMKASNLLECVNLNRFHETRDETQLTHEAVKLTRLNEFSAGLVFMKVEEIDEKPLNVEYKIRMDIESVPTTSRIRNQFWTPGPEGNFLEEMRYFRGFVQIQDLVDSAIVHLAGNSSMKRLRRDTESQDHKYGVYTQQMPYPCYRRDYFQSSLYESQALIVAFFFALLLSVCSAIRFIVYEKESGNTMLQSACGVAGRHGARAWAAASAAEAACACACACLVLRAGAVLPRTHVTLLLALLLDYAFSVLMFCYMISKLFKSASLAAVCGGLAYMVTFMPFVIILSLEAVLTLPAKLLTSLSMSTAFCYSLLHVSRLEAAGGGARWEDVWRPLDEDGVTIAITALCIFVDGIIYLIIGWLIDCFFGIKTIKSNITYCLTSSEKAGVSVLNVSKIYHEGSSRAKIALDNVSMELRRGQITTLLGHNGAGKTTLLKIMTGMLKPSRGTVVVRSGSAGAGARALGVCPQRDVLYEELSAREHVQLYARLKGAAGDELRDEVDSMMRALAFTEEQQRCSAKRLSGGLRRRLSVGLGFVRRPRLVLLDEPASGVDPTHTRGIWSLIMKLKEDRTILLTTHQLEEAELLSDQVVIMHKGQIHTSGSPMDIKRALGTGYSLTVHYPLPPFLPPPLQHEEGLHEDISIEEQSKKLLAAVSKVVRNAQLLDVSGSEVEINLPFFDSDGVNNDFLGVCTHLETQQNELGFQRYAMDCSSLEQIMYNICSKVDDQVDCSSNYGESPSHSASSSVGQLDRPLVPMDGPLRGTSMQQFKALLHKRYMHYTRNRWLLFLVLVLPSLFVSVAMSFSMIRPPPDAERPLPLTPQLYPAATHFLIPYPSVYSQIDPRLAEDVMRILQRDRACSNWTVDDSPTCECTGVRQECTYNITKRDHHPEMMLLPDIAVMNDWLITSQPDYIEKRYGGFTSALKGNATSFLVWYNNKGHHALPSYLSALHEGLLRRASDNLTARLRTYTHPLKISHEQLSKSTLLQHVADVGISGMLLLGYSLVPAAAAIYLVQERCSQQKRLQLLSGVRPALYWTAAGVWDLGIIVINISLTVCVLLAFGFPVFVARDNLPAICLLLFLFGLSCNSLVHVLEKLFTDPSLANMILFCGNTFIGLSGLAILLIMDIISESDATDNARWTLHKIFLLSPQFALGDALLEIAKNTVQAEVLSRFGMDTYVSPLFGSLITYHYIALISLTVLFTTLNLAIEYDLFEPFRRIDCGASELFDDEEEDEDILIEKRRVESQYAARPVRLQTLGNINNGYTCGAEEKLEAGAGSVLGGGRADDVLQCVSVTALRGRGRAPALRRLTVGLPPGQCTALLGENGAGKSTTFAVLSGELRPARGRLVLRGRTARAASLRGGEISYCPQSNAIDPLLTVEETLRFFCDLRGISDKNNVINRTMDLLSLCKYREVRSGALSGGNQRKLCAAVALMARSSLVLLDEPTSGMDPASRARVSRACRTARRAGRAVLASSHAPADVARWAQRALLLAGGRARALAPLHACLHRFGAGVTVRARCRSARAAWRELSARAPSARLRALQHRALVLHLPATARVNDKEIKTSLSDVFRLLYEMQASGVIEDFTVNQSSLDEMYLSLSDSKDSEQDVLIDPLPTSKNEQRNGDDSIHITPF